LLLPFTHHDVLRSVATGLTTTGYIEHDIQHADKTNPPTETVTYQ